MHLEDTVNTVLVIATFSLAKILHMSCIDFFPFLVGLANENKNVSIRSNSSKMRAKIYFDTDFLKFLIVFNIQICSVLVILIRASNLFNFKLQETQFRTLVSSLICFMYPDFYKHHHKNEYMGELTARNGYVMFIDDIT